MFKLIFICISLFSLSGFSQSETEHLKKYSYILIHSSKGEVQNFTGFFYKKSGKTFLVSNYHTFSGINIFNGIKESVIDTLLIFYKIQMSSKYSSFKIPIKIELKEDPLFYRSIDLMAYEIVPPGDMPINYINDFIDPKYLHQKPTEVYSYGYPASIQNWGSYKISLMKGYYDDDFNNEYKDVVKKDNPSLSESNLNSFVEKVKSECFLIPQEFLEGGRSGSPVFGKFYKIENGKKVEFYKFVGIIFGHDDRIKKALAHKLDVVLNYFKTL